MEFRLPLSFLIFLNQFPPSPLQGIPLNPPFFDQISQPRFNLTVQPFPLPPLWRQYNFNLPPSPQKIITSCEREPRGQVYISCRLVLNRTGCSSSNFKRSEFMARNGTRSSIHPWPRLFILRGMYRNVIVFLKGENDWFFDGVCLVNEKRLNQKGGEKVRPTNRIYSTTTPDLKENFPNRSKGPLRDVKLRAVLDLWGPFVSPETEVMLSSVESFFTVCMRGVARYRIMLYLVVVPTGKVSRSVLLR